TGHLLYSRFWNKFLKDRGLVPTEEPFHKLINQGMILGTSAFFYGFGIGVKNINPEVSLFKPQRYAIPKKSFDMAQNGIYDNVINSIVEKELNKYRDSGNVNVEWSLDTTVFTPIHVDVSLVNFSDELDIEKFKSWRKDFSDFEFIL